MIHASVRLFLPPHGDWGDEAPSGPGELGAPAPGEDLPYRVEVWDEAGTFAERVIAITASAAIGYAAYYAAAAENPGRVITLRFNGQVVSRWSDRTH